MDSNISKVLTFLHSPSHLGGMIAAFRKVAAFTLLCILMNCGSKNSFDCESPTSGVPCAERTQDEEARLALDRGDMESAVTILQKLIDGEPANYTRYPILAAALAGRSGFDIFNIVKGNFGGSSSLIETMGSFLPTPQSKGAAYDNSLADMKKSVAVLQSVPESLRSNIESDKFAASCALQLTLYQAAYSVMLINKYSYSSTGFDPSKLSTMTADDAAAILQSLISAGSVVSGTSGEAASAAVNAAVSSIKSQPGANDQERIANYVQANKKS